MNFNPADFHPKFVAAMEALERIPEVERDTHPAVADLIAQLMAYAPEPLKAIFSAKAHELGLFPKTEFYTEDGKPVYTIVQLAKHLGISLEEAIRMAERLYEEHPDLAWSAGSKSVYRRQ